MAVSVPNAGAIVGQVKLSRSGICHTADSPYYNKTKTFTGYSTLRDCLKHGRLPKGYRSAAVNPRSANITPPAISGKRYNREYFGAWIDADNDCQNTRHELLAQLSTTRPTYTRSRCRVIHGRWLDPYTNKTFLEATDLDIDHLVPLKWGWDHGARSWSARKRQAFANDPRNLFAVQASVNREKGAQGPLNWLPPNPKFWCEYVLRFERIMALYQLRFSQAEMHRFIRLKNGVCQS
ncbi:HNH endonuclease family protein [Pseudovibrio ascidiaceicola]|uniref:HNH endonuclease family protein n=1 Tax=Pseudovibrio ascidiaceicola TaxID=285279 RepID=UPI003D35A3BB